jgi:D-glycero-alpha-D-manno-heptose 1-phosphate guanylyltransferase
LGFKEKHGVGKGLINAGLYLINKQWMLNNLPKPIFSFEAFLTEQVSSIHIGVVPVTGAFIDIGIPEDYKLAQSFIPSLFKK